jgi:hypothetical protein
VVNGRPEPVEERRHPLGMIGPSLGSHGVAVGDVIGVATAVVPPIVRPALAEPCAAMEPVAVDAHDVGRWLG